MLRNIAQGKITVQVNSPESDLLQQFLLNRIKYLEPRKPLRSELLNVALGFERFVYEGQLATLNSQLQKMRRNLAFRLMNFQKQQADLSANKPLQIYQITNVRNMSQINVTLGNGVTIQGNLVVANAIRDSFNKSESAKIESELKSQLKDLCVSYS